MAEQHHELAHVFAEASQRVSDAAVACRAPQHPLHLSRLYESGMD